MFTLPENTLIKIVLEKKKYSYSKAWIFGMLIYKKLVIVALSLPQPKSYIYKIYNSRPLFSLVASGSPSPFS